MNVLLVLASIVVLVVVAVIAFGAYRNYRLFPAASTETVQLTPEKRASLQQLRAERKFQPHNYPPLGYTGAETPAEELRAATAVNRTIDAVLAHSDGPIRAKDVAALLSNGLSDLALLATEDRDRAQGYLIEIWYLLGFKDATGRFAYGSAYRIPHGYGEPLPPGWTAPDKPRSMN